MLALAGMKRHMTLRDNTGKRIRVVLDNSGAAVVPQNLIRTHGNAGASGDGSFRTDEFEESALARTGVTNSGKTLH
jgi:hypothetical protein